MSITLGKTLVRLTLSIGLFGANLAGFSAQAAELVMIERSGCSYCVKWDREVAAIYSKSPEGQRAPLKRFNLDDGKPNLQLNAPLRYTPTFVLVDGTKEIGRITGYMNDAMFWGLLGKLMEQLPSTAPTVVTR